MEEISFTNFEDTTDNYILMHKWCSQEYIYRWFEQRVLTYDEIVKKYQDKLHKNNQKLYIINYNKNPIGFIQIYKYNDITPKELKKYNNIYTYDIFIGEQSYLSKGIGSKIIKIVNNYIFNNYESDCIVLIPSKSNIRAIKCYQKNNFEIIETYEGIDTIGNKESFVLLINNHKC